MSSVENVLKTSVYFALHVMFVTAAVTDDNILYRLKTFARKCFNNKVSTGPQKKLVVYILKYLLIWLKCFFFGTVCRKCLENVCLLSNYLGLIGICL